MGAKPPGSADVQVKTRDERGKTLVLRIIRNLSFFVANSPATLFGVKLRILGDSVRLRLTQGEVKRLRAGNPVEAQAHFGGPHLTYRCVPSDHVTSPTADLSLEDDAAVIRLRIPTLRVAGWADTDEVSILAEQRLDEDRTLRILIEKDFACLKPRDAVQDADTFPHPLAGN